MTCRSFDDVNIDGVTSDVAVCQAESWHISQSLEFFVNTNLLPRDQKGIVYNNQIGIYNINIFNMINLE